MAPKTADHEAVGVSVTVIGLVLLLTGQESVGAASEVRTVNVVEEATGDDSRFVPPCRDSTSWGTATRPRTCSYARKSARCAEVESSVVMPPVDSVTLLPVVLSVSTTR